jgi:hypothetical protein
MAKLIVINSKKLTISAEEHKKTLMENPVIARILEEIEIEIKKSQSKQEDC